jgi:hypothetical protein
MMEAIWASKTSVLTRATRHHIPEDGILHSCRCENLKYYIWCYCLVFKLILTDFNFLQTFGWRGEMSGLPPFPCWCLWCHVVS